MDQVQIGEQVRGGSEPGHDLGKDVSIDFREVAFTQFPQAVGHLRTALGELREPRDQHVLAVGFARQRDCAYVRIDKTLKQLACTRRIECGEGVDEFALALLERRCIGRKLGQKVDGGIRPALAESGDEIAQFVSTKPPRTASTSRVSSRALLQDRQRRGRGPRPGTEGASLTPAPRAVSARGRRRLEQTPRPRAMRRRPRASAQPPRDRCARPIAKARAIASSTAFAEPRPSIAASAAASFALPAAD